MAAEAFRQELHAAVAGVGSEPPSKDKLWQQPIVPHPMGAALLGLKREMANPTRFLQ
jgi:hypothetical protein